MTQNSWKRKNDQPHRDILSLDPLQMAEPGEGGIVMGLNACHKQPIRLIHEALPPVLLSCLPLAPLGFHSAHIGQRSLEGGCLMAWALAWGQGHCIHGGCSGSCQSNHHRELDRGLGSHQWEIPSILAFEPSNPLLLVLPARFWPSTADSK